MRYDDIASGKRKPVKVSIDTGIVQAARDVGLNLSQTSEAGLIAAIKRERERRWKEENREAIDSSNTWFEENGMPYVEWRL
jgi:antitoxin CcdA